jgi:hypothetical protein
VWPSNSQISSPSTAILALGKARSYRNPNLGRRGVDRRGWYDALPKKNLHESCRMRRRIVVMKLICSLGHCECQIHTVHKVSQRRFTTVWLAPRESDCLRMDSKVSDWLPNIKATRPVLVIFKMTGYFPDSPRPKDLFHVESFNTQSMFRANKIRKKSRGAQEWKVAWEHILLKNGS